MTARGRPKLEGRNLHGTTIACLCGRQSNADALRSSGRSVACPCDLVSGHHPVLVWLGELLGNLIRRMWR